MLPAPAENFYSYFEHCNFLVSTDTRKIVKDCLFICLKGTNFNGNTFAESALAAGAKYVWADEEKYCTHPNIVLVENCLQALQTLALQHALQMPAKKLIVGGSNGKTTTKELCQLVLGSTFNTIATIGNLNNHIGVPLTLLQITPEHEWAIIEMGTNHPGEMKVLCDLVNADAGIVTNIGKEHLEGFGDLEAVAREESEVYLALQKSGGHAIVNADDFWLENMSRRLPAKTTISINSNADITAKTIQSMPFLKYSVHTANASWEGTCNIGGEYNLYNILFAIATGKFAGIEIEKCIQSISNYSSSNNRSQWIEKFGKKILLDAYNANPSSMEVALRAFQTLPGEKLILLGDMFELGEESLAEHKNILQLCKELGFNQCYFAGKNFCDANLQLDTGYTSYANTESLKIALGNLETIPAEWIFVKGSRGMKMESLF